MKLTEENARKLGEILLVERKKRGLSLEQVRQKLESLDIIINRSDINRLEKAQRKTPNALLLSGLCQIYNLNFSEVFDDIGFHNTSMEIMPSLSEKKVKIFSSLKYAVEEDLNKVIGEIGKVKDTKNNIVAFVMEDDSMKYSFSKGDLIFLEKGLEVANNKIGVFLVDEEYKIFKKKIVSDEIVLITDDDTSPVISGDLKEIGTIIATYKEL